jgi:hypothetical protein
VSATGAVMYASRRHDETDIIQVFRCFNLCHLSAIYLEIPSLGAYAKLRRATISSVMSVCPSVRLPIRVEHLASQWTDFHDIGDSNIFLKSVEKSQV